MHDTGTLLQAQLALSGNTKKTHGANQRNKTTIQCMMHSQNRHSRSLTFDLFSFSNSPRPPLAGLYTTCIYKQYKGLTAVCTRRPPVCLTDWLVLYDYCSDYPASVDQRRKKRFNVPNFWVNFKLQKKNYKYWYQFKISNWSKHTGEPSLSVTEPTVKSRRRAAAGVWSLTSRPVLKLSWSHEHGSTCTWPRRYHDMKIWVPKYLK